MQEYSFNDKLENFICRTGNYCIYLILSYGMAVSLQGRQTLCRLQSNSTTSHADGKRRKHRLSINIFEVNFTLWCFAEICL